MILLISEYNTSKLNKSYNCSFNNNNIKIEWLYIKLANTILSTSVVSSFRFDRAKLFESKIKKIGLILLDF